VSFKCYTILFRFFLLTCLPQKAFFQKKKGKKKAIKRYGQRGKPKGNGIIGGVPFRGGNRLCRSLLVAGAAGVHNTLAAFLSFSYWKMFRQDSPIFIIRINAEYQRID
jgi:hypothetical protein